MRAKMAVSFLKHSLRVLAEISQYYIILKQDHNYEKVVKGFVSYFQ